MNSERIEKVLAFLSTNGLEHTYYTHPEAPTIDIARQYWQKDGSKHCKNLFFRNHKGNRHYLVVLDCEKYHRLAPGSMSPFGHIKDTEKHEHLFLDKNLRNETSLSFHPNDNRATVVISQQEFMRYLSIVGNTYEFIEMY